MSSVDLPDARGSHDVEVVAGVGDGQRTARRPPAWASPSSFGVSVLAQCWAGIGD